MQNGSAVVPGTAQQDGFFLQCTAKGMMNSRKAAPAAEQSFLQLIARGMMEELCPLPCSNTDLQSFLRPRR